MSRAWLSVIGIGEAGLAALSPDAAALVADAELFVGGARHLAMLGDDPRPRMPWEIPLDRSIGEFDRLRHLRIVVLASGDPLWFGVARKLVGHFGPDAVEVVPSVASMQLACARLRWSLAETEVVTIHGRPLTRLVRWLQPGRKLIILCADRHSPHQIADLLQRSGFGSARLHVLEHLGGPEEQVRNLRAAEVAEHMFRDLVIVGIEVPAGEQAVRPLVPGLPDDAFLHDGQLTKREVRAATLARLGPLPGQRLWDIGAGAGSVSIEWLRAQPGTRAIAIERVPERAERIRANAVRLGTPELVVVEGDAPGALHGLPRPDAIFLGGAVAADGLIAMLQDQLESGGRLLANAVTVDGEAALLAAYGAHGGELARIAVARAEPLGGVTAWRAAAPVTQWAWTKP
ncbi:MAG TPA: precorrin-6y C5,15-methyltransferase (decarboxylating) subunit CbiE [Geminicoccus sp.]|jgi:precorrin-6Y C5,15-methyltransferase (decarboxylating)|uniref:precorrin-6y C5,15-methyltransferase (decarboxylating) subunit CbiE n=1 Tax=Geminicoccus sp. TaxID=2024832 RepID=UPI002E37EE2E|nr:precorrin-6y C5,15-methyltransferase (decarboxylating) subunit CbiE [Geminicoccus sp.]HEX2525710.1 precorrin-6y C5,15-methyltransferase (decarboxylating) subunit CbiE [Geminicoccus sp.]